MHGVHFSEFRSNTLEGCSNAPKPKISMVEDAEDDAMLSTWLDGRRIELAARADILSWSVGVDLSHRYCTVGTVIVTAATVP